MHKLRRQQLDSFGSLECKDELLMRIGTWNSEIISTHGDEKIINYIKNKINTLTLNDMRANEYLLRSMYAIELGLNSSLVANYYGALVSSVLLPDYIFDWDETAIEKEMDEIIYRARAKERYKLKKEGFFHINIGCEELFMDEIERYGSIPSRTFNIGGMFGNNRFTFDDTILVYTAIIPVRLVKGNTYIKEDTESQNTAVQKPATYAAPTEIFKFEQVMEVLTGLFGKGKKGEFCIEEGKYIGFYIQTSKMTDEGLRFGSDQRDKYFAIRLFHPEMTAGQDEIELKNMFSTMLELNNFIINKIAEAFNYKNGKRYCTYSHLATLLEEKADETTDEKLNEKFKHLLVKVKTPVYFNEIGGQKKAKEELEDLVNAFKYEQIIKAWATKPPSGIVLEGPPGTGKTQLAIALASSIDAEVYKIKLTDIMSNAYINNGAKNIAELFTFLRARSKSEKRKIVVILDEMEALFTTRGNAQSSQEDTKVVNTFLTEMNTCEEDENIIFIGTTNNMELVDKAVMRSGRMTKKVKVNLPDKTDRLEVLEIHIKKALILGKRKLFSENLDLSKIAAETDKFSGADLMEIIREALYSKAKLEIKGVPKEELMVETKDLLLAAKEIKKSAGHKNPVGFGRDNN